MDLLGAFIVCKPILAVGQNILLRGRIFRRVQGGRKDDLLIATADDFVALLKREFELDLPETADLWPRICERHEQLFANAPA